MSVRIALASALLAFVFGAVPAHAQRIGEFSVRGGAAIATPADSVEGGTGPSVEASFGTRFGPVVVLLEGGYLGVSSERHAWRYGVGVRYEIGPGPWRPGAGVRRGFGSSPFSLLAESRLHIRMQNAFPENDTVGLELVTVLVGGTVSW